MKTSSRSVTAILLLAIAFAPSLALAKRNNNNNGNRNVVHLDWENLQSDIHGAAEFTDPNVTNPWGIAVANNGVVFVADNGAGVATAYFQDGTPFPNFTSPLVVSIPASATNTEGANPTGVVSNNTAGFKITSGGNSQPARLIFVSEDGMISGWNPSIDATNAIKAVDNGASGAIYKGAAIAVVAGPTSNASGQARLYVANFFAGKVEVYDENFAPIGNPGFVDPNLPAGYAPFNIRNFGNQLFVSYALQDADKHDDVPGAGLGIIDVFNTNGVLLRRLISNGGNLNAPWGMEIVNGALWVGNFGDGAINIYNPNNGNFLGVAKDDFGIPLQFDGLWALYLSEGGLFFSAGIVDEEHGIFGVIFN